MLNAFDVVGTCSDTHWRGDDPAERVRSDALVRGGVHVRPELLRTEGKQSQAAVARR